MPKIIKRVERERRTKGKDAKDKNSRLKEKENPKKGCQRN